MKLSLNTDFTKMPRAGSVIHAADARSRPAAFDHVVLAHDERHLRRRVLALSGGERILVDLPDPAQLDAGDLLVLDDGRHAEIRSADEELLDVRARDAVHLAELAWHIGNRHLAAQIGAERILILRDHVIRAMLEGLGARVADVVEPFSPVRGAYAGHGHHHHGAHGDHHHPEADRYGRQPGDPHYGHDHA